MPKKKISMEISKYMSAIGKKGGAIGGKRSLETMTPEARSARAKKAVAARELKRVSKALEMAKSNA